MDHVALINKIQELNLREAGAWQEGKAVRERAREMETMEREGEKYRGRERS